MSPWMPSVFWEIVLQDGWESHWRRPQPGEDGRRPSSWGRHPELRMTIRLSQPNGSSRLPSSNHFSDVAGPTTIFS